MKEDFKKTMLGPLPVAIIFILILRFGGTLGGNPAHAYHDRVIGEHNKKIASKMIDLFQSLDKRNPEEMVNKLEIIQLQIDDSLKKLSKTDDFYGNTRLRDAAIDLYKFYKSIGEKEYVEMITILSSEDLFISQADAARLQELKEYIVNGEAEYVGKVHAAEKEFAQLHGFKLKFRTYQEYIKD